MYGILRDLKRKRFLEGWYQIGKTQPIGRPGWETSEEKMIRKTQKMIVY